MAQRSVSAGAFVRPLLGVLALAVALPLVGSSGVSPAHAASTTLLISEFRLRGPNGANDEFIEIANISAGNITIAGGGAGFAVAASDGVARCVIPNGAVIPRFGHYLCVNSVGYSLASYPAGNGSTATGDDTYVTDIPDNAGIALFNTSLPGDFTLANRIDAVGSTSEANLVYKEGVGYPALTPFSIDYSFYRNLSTSSIATPAPVTAVPGVPEDTDNNATDFVFVDTNGTSAGAGQRLGAPGPENLSGPVADGGLAVSLLDPCVDRDTAPNAVRDVTSDPANNSTFGTIEYRRTITNNTGGNVTRLRARIADLRTFPAPSGIADMRPRTSTAVVVTVDQAPCGSGTSNVAVQGTTLEQPPSQPNGGGFNSSLSAGTVTLATPLAPGASIDVRFLFGLQQTGDASANIIIEALGGTATTPTLTCLGASASGITDFCGLVALDDAYTTFEDTALIEPALTGVLANDSDPEADPITAALLTGPSNGTLALSPDGSFTYTPNPDFNGIDSFTYEVSDGTNTDPATVSLTIDAVNDAPVSADDAYPGTEDTALAIAAPGVLANDTDADGDALTASLVTGPANGTLVLNADGSFTYTPNANFNGADSFTYLADDGTAMSVMSTVTLAIAPVDEPTTTTTTTTTIAPPAPPTPTAPPTMPTTPELPATGSDSGRVAALAVVVLLFGICLSGLTALTRRHARR